MNLERSYPQLQLLLDGSSEICSSRRAERHSIFKKNRASLGGANERGARHPERKGRWTSSALGHALLARSLCNMEIGSFGKRR